jgi:hypothetical protein
MSVPRYYRHELCTKEGQILDRCFVLAAPNLLRAEARPKVGLPADGSQSAALPHTRPGHTGSYAKTPPATTPPLEAPSSHETRPSPVWISLQNISHILEPADCGHTAHLHEIRLNANHTQPLASCHYGRTKAPAGDRQGPPTIAVMYMPDVCADNEAGDEAHSGRRSSISGHSREARAVNKFLAEREARGFIEEGNQEASAVKRQGEGLDKLQ